jgi:hypothetical protein
MNTVAATLVADAPVDLVGFCRQKKQRCGDRGSAFSGFVKFASPWGPYQRKDGVIQADGSTSGRSFETPGG